MSVENSGLNEADVRSVLWRGFAIALIFIGRILKAIPLSDEDILS